MINEMDNEIKNHNFVIKFLKKFISFETFIAPSIIVLFFWLSLIIVCLGGLEAIFSGNIIYGVIEIILGAILVKVLCEIFMVPFKINHNLKEITQNTKQF